SVDKADEIAIIEIFKAMHFVHGRDSVPEPRHDLRRQLEAEIRALGANVEDQVAGRGHRMARSGLDFLERMQFRRPRQAKEIVPGGRSKSHHAGKIPFKITKTHSA